MNIYDVTLDKLIALIGKKQISRDIFAALYRDGVSRIDDLPVRAEIKSVLKDSFTDERIECVDISDGGSAVKYLFRLADGNLVETVLMRHEYGGRVCVSTQAGCNMGCVFCRSGRMKKVRDLTAGEMVQQLLRVRELSGSPICGVAVMGIGEPFDNFGNLLDFIDIALYQNGLNIGPRHITVSTCGLVPKIYELAESRYNVNLAISLHAPENELRTRLMPVNKAYPLEELIPAAIYFGNKTNRRVTLEYVMLEGVNDSREQAEILAGLIAGSKCYVNIIRYNSSDGDDEFRCSSDERLLSFYDALKKKGARVTVRREMGAGVNAACGQLRGDYMTVESLKL